MSERGEAALSRRLPAPPASGGARRRRLPYFNLSYAR